MVWAQRVVDPRGPRGPFAERGLLPPCRRVATADRPDPLGRYRDCDVLERLYGWRGALRRTRRRGGPRGARARVLTPRSGLFALTERRQPRRSLTSGSASAGKSRTLAASTP